MAEKIKELIRDYQEGKISRREFMRQAVLATGSLATASSMIDMLMPFMTRADMVRNEFVPHVVVPAGDAPASSSRRCHAICAPSRVSS